MQAGKVTSSTRKFNYVALKNQVLPKDLKLNKRTPRGFTCYTIALIGRDFYGKADPTAEIFLTEIDFTSHSIKWQQKPDLKDVVLGSWSYTWENYYRIKRDYDKEKYPFLYYLRVVRILDLETWEDVKKLRLRVWRSDPLAITIHDNRSILNLTGIERELDLPRGTLQDYSREGIPRKHRKKIVRYLHLIGRELLRLNDGSIKLLSEKTEKRS